MEQRILYREKFALQQIQCRKKERFFLLCYHWSDVWLPEVGKVTLKSNGDEALNDEFLLKCNGDVALNDVFPQKVTVMKRLTLNKNCSNEVMKRLTLLKN